MTVNDCYQMSTVQNDRETGHNKPSCSALVCNRAAVDTHLFKEPRL